MKQFIQEHISSIKIILSILIVLIHFVFWFPHQNNLVFASMIESCFDVLMVCLISYTMKIANKPADSDHHYGHQKFEPIMSLIISVLFLAVSIKIVDTSILNIVNGIPPVGMDFSDLIMIILLSIPTLGMVILEKKDSGLSRFNFIHYLSDFLKIILMGISYILCTIGFISYFDSIASIIISFIILLSLIPNIIDSINILTDKEIDMDKKEILLDVLSGYDTENLRTRKSGKINFIEFELLLDSDLSLIEAESIKLVLDTNIRNSMPNTDVKIIICSKQENPPS